MKKIIRTLVMSLALALMMGLSVYAADAVGDGWKSDNIGWYYIPYEGDDILRELLQTGTEENDRKALEQYETIGFIARI